MKDIDRMLTDLTSAGATDQDRIALVVDVVGEVCTNILTVIAASHSHMHAFQRLRAAEAARRLYNAAAALGSMVRAVEVRDARA